MGEQTQQPAGLGKLFFCPAEEFERLGMAAPMQEIQLAEPSRLSPGMLTYKDDGDAKPDYSAKGFNATFTGTMEEPSDELIDLIKKPIKWDVKLQRQLGRMPRKMKKAHRSDYPRNTKWKRKVANYLRRMTIYLHNGELVVTEEQFYRLSATICGSKVQ